VPQEKTENRKTVLWECNVCQVKLNNTQCLQKVAFELGAVVHTYDPSYPKHTDQEVYSLELAWTKC
jgi:hypothetical protein